MLHPRPLIQFLIIQISTHLHPPPPPPPAATASREHLNSVGLNVCMKKTAAGVQCCSAAGCCMTSVMCLCRVMNEEKCSQGQSWDLQSYHYEWILGDVSDTSSKMSVSASARSSHQYPCIWRPGWRYQPRVKTVHCA